MPYFPKNRIQTNLYTAGDEFYIPGIDPNYIGHYFALYNGLRYTGKTPSDSPTYLLIPFDKVGNDTSKNSVSNVDIIYTKSIRNSTYSNLKNINTLKIIQIPQLFYTKPTESDYKLGEFQRYFCKKRNELMYLEISKTDFDKLSTQNSIIDYKNWIPFQIPWEITGEKDKVYNTNRNIVLLEEKKNNLYGFRKYLQEDYLRYYKP